MNEIFFNLSINGNDLFKKLYKNALLKLHEFKDSFEHERIKSVKLRLCNKAQCESQNYTNIFSML